MKYKGISFIELLLVLVVVAILSAIALPNYQTHLYQAERFSAQNNLYQLQIWLEQEFTATESYPSKIDCQECQLSTLYDFSISKAEDTLGYQIIATPKKGSKQQKDSCYAQVLDNFSAQKNWDKNGEEINKEDCWRY